MTTGIGLGISRGDNETWLDAAVRLATPHGLEDEIARHYEMNIAQGAEDSEAAFRAVMAWDIAERAEVDSTGDVVTVPSLLVRLEEQAKEHAHEVWGLNEKIRELQDAIDHLPGGSKDVE